MSGDLIDTTEMYLRTILELMEEGVAPLRARIAERLEQASPTVSQTVARMERDGLLTVGADRTIVLSEAGLEQAVQVMRRHRLAERLLTDIIGLPLEQVHDEACRWEHVISPQVEGRLVVLLDHPTETPYGTPIPSGDGSDGARVPDFLVGVVALADVVTAEERPVLVRRLSENVQRDRELLAGFVAAGVMPGARVAARRGDGGVELAGPGGPLTIPGETADDVYVEA